MKTIRLEPLRIARRVKQFNLSLLATLAALALTACDGGEPPVMGASSLSKGVQQVLQASGSRGAQDGTHIALAAQK